MANVQVHLLDGHQLTVDENDRLADSSVQSLNGVTAGTVTASKFVKADANSNIGVVKATQLHIGTSGSETQVTATGAELNYVDIATLGTGAVSKAVVLDASGDYTFPASATIVMPSGGDMTFASGSTLDVAGTFTNNATGVRTAQAAEHGAGAIGTSSFGAPQVRRWTDAGVIITQHKFDLTGLRSVATANDVIGLQAGGTANIGRNVEATNGVIFKTEFSCLETPVGGDNDVNVVIASSSSLAYDGAGGTTYAGGDAGDLLKGQTISFLTPAFTEGHYYYLTAGTGDTLGDYTAGMYVLTTYGHAVLS